MTVENYPAPLGYDQAVELATKVVAEVGEGYVYPGHRGDAVCVYVDKGEPMCFVAKMLHHHGVPVEVLREWEGLNAGHMHHTKALPNGRPVPTPPLVADFKTARFLDHLQNYQDGGATWADALQRTLNGIKPFPSAAVVLEA